MDISALTRRLDPGPERLARLARLYAGLVVPALLLVLVVMESPRADGRHDLSGATFGHDFSQVWVAGRTALAGHAAQVYDIAAHYRHLVATFGPDAALFAWHYPPMFLLPAALLARLPYPAALLAWDSASLLLLAVALRAILGGWRPALIGLAVPTVADSLAYGQNGLLTASLLGLGLRLAGRRPWAAGVLLGLVGYKPQLAAFVPFVLLLDGDRRVAVAALATVAATAAASVAAFGVDPWIAFVHGLPDTNADIFTEVWAGRALNASAFGAVRLLGGPIAAAWAVQVVVAVAAFGLVMWTRHRVRAAPGGPALANAVLLAAVPLVSPYVPLYDLAVLVPAGAFLVVGAAAAGGLVASERAAVAPLFVLAFATGRTAAAHVPAGFLLTIGLFSLSVVAAARRARAAAPEGSAQHATRSCDVVAVSAAGLL